MYMYFSRTLKLEDTKTKNYTINCAILFFNRSFMLRSDTCAVVLGGCNFGQTFDYFCSRIYLLEGTKKKQLYNY